MTRKNFICKNNSRWQMAFAFLAVGIILVITACATNYGSLKRDSGITAAFEAYQVVPGYRYYHLGWANRPYAVVGLEKSYHIKSNQWIEFDPDPQQLKKVVDAVEIFREVGYDRLYGSYILDPEGNRIGIWYSSLLIASVRVDNASKLVSFSTDEPWVRGDQFDL